MVFLQWLQNIFVALLNWIQVAILNIGAWNNNPNAAPARMRGRMRYFIGSAIFLLVLSIGGAVIHNVWLMVLPWMLGTLIVYLAIPGLNLGLNIAAGSSVDAKQSIKLAFQGVFGWMFWIWGACTWLIMYPPWPAALWSIVLLCIFLAFSFLCRFLGTLRIASKVVFFAILCLAFVVRFSGVSNNELLQEIKESVVSRAHHWVTRDKISRAERGVRSKANETVAEEISQQNIQDRIYLVYEGAPIRDTQGIIKCYADDVLYVVLADRQPAQPSELIGEFWLFYLPDLELTQFKRNFSADPITRRAKPVIRCSEKQFVKKEDRKVWISSTDVDLDVEIKEAREPRVRSSVRNAASGNPGGSTHQTSGFLERIRINKDQAVWYGLWVAAALVGLYLVRKKLKNKTIRAMATVVLVVIAVWLGLIGLANAVSLAPVQVVNSASAGNENLIQQPKPQTPRGKVATDKWQVVDRISATSQELAQGVPLPDGALTLRWPRWGFLRFRVEGSNNGWARYLPWGDNYYVGYKNGRELILHGGMRRYFEDNSLPGYAVCLTQEDQLIKSWPLTVNQLPEDNRTGIRPDAIDLPVFQVPAGTNRVLRVNKPLDIKAGIEWDDDFIIILEVVEYQTSYRAFINERPFLFYFYIVRLGQLLL